MPTLVRLPRALHALQSPPQPLAWNLDEMHGLLDPTAALKEAAVLVGLVDRAEGTQVLLTRRTDILRHHAGQVSFPGGRLEPGDEGPVGAALRETQEEIGVGPELVTPLGFLDPLATITGFRVVPVVARVAPTYVALPEPGEVADVFEVPLGFLMAPDNLITRDVEVQGRPRRILEFVEDSQDRRRRIWGVTASILYNLRERLVTVSD
ncbi:NUDIX domain-containing protein [Lysobacter ruishenii]|uniref:NUDIX domain-containing protein n=1 Tax=Aerolutibacter ruishenii TaxID=686800 RepID=A0A562LSJ6_9GAMM|nr:NUDIX domain-containing protein [Lysobacter ruishenii]